jgi:hypothetical protein
VSPRSIQGTKQVGVSVAAAGRVNDRTKETVGDGTGERTYERSRFSSCLYPSSRSRARPVSSPAVVPALLPPPSAADLFHVMARRVGLASSVTGGGCVAAVGDGGELEARGGGG